MNGFQQFGLLLLGFVVGGTILANFRKPVVDATQSFVENKSAGSANHSLANHLRPTYEGGGYTGLAKELSEAHNHSIYDNILLNHSQRLRILQNGGP